MIKIKRFRMKQGIVLNVSHMNSKASFINPKATHSVSIPLVADIYLYIGFPDDISKWNDLDYVLVLDDDFGQPYTPFYKRFGEARCERVAPFLETVIFRYNEEMAKFPYLEEIEDMEEA